MQFYAIEIARLVHSQHKTRLGRAAPRTLTYLRRGFMASTSFDESFFLSAVFIYMLTFCRNRNGLNDWIYEKNQEAGTQPKGVSGAVKP